MPAPSIKAFAKKLGKSEKEIEELWDKAKKVAKKEFGVTKADGEKFYKITMGVLKKWLGVKKKAESVQEIKERLIRISGKESKGLA